MQRQGKKLVAAARLLALGQLYDPRAQEDDDADLANTMDEAAAGFGLRIDEGDDEEGEEVEPGDEDRMFYLWPCNAATFNVWRQIQTQWIRNAMGELDGLNYASVTSYMNKVARIKRKDFAEMFSGIQAMERAILELQAEKRPSP